MDRTDIATPWSIPPALHAYLPEGWCVKCRDEHNRTRSVLCGPLNSPIMYYIMIDGVVCSRWSGLGLKVSDFEGMIAWTPYTVSKQEGTKQ